MKPLHEYMNEYKKQIEKGDIQLAYKGLMEYLLKLRVYFKKKYPNYHVSGNIYQGYMDMTYFAFFPESLKLRKLKIALVFVYDKFRFEIWLAAKNKQAQNKYWNFFKESNWKNYSIPSMIEGLDSIVEHVLVENPDFKDLDKVTEQIERKTMTFIEDIESFLSKHEADF